MAFGLYYNINRAKTGTPYMWSITENASAGSPGRVIGYTDAAVMHSARIGRSESKHRTAVNKDVKQVYQWFYGAFNDRFVVVGDDARKDRSLTGRKLLTASGRMIEQDTPGEYVISCRHGIADGQFYYVNARTILSPAFVGVVLVKNRTCYARGE
jgi:hypothetical protein